MMITQTPRYVGGRDLRWILTTYLVAQGPLTVARMVALLERDGFEVLGRPSKAVSDALRWEIGRRRVVKIGRGTYAVGVIPRTTARRIYLRVRELSR
jgi:hypothetical protein